MIKTTTTNDDDNYLNNPEPQNEHVGVDEEGMYLELEPQTKGTDAFEEDVPVSDSECESDSDDDYEEYEADEMVKDKVPLSNPKIVYEKMTHQ